MPPKFGTSGLRGLVTELTPDLIRAHVAAFIAACPTGGGVHVGRDLRPSSPAIAAEVLAAVQRAGLCAIDAGEVPTPALALSAMAAGHAAVMVTGSHIPADRNGLKFYLPTGEISKADEAAILAWLGHSREAALAGPPPWQDQSVQTAFLHRYLTAFGPKALQGLRIGIWQHSTVIRDLLTEVVSALGGQPVPLGRSEEFIPIDTEAVPPEARAQIAAWCRAEALGALISADGDADRPLLADAAGQILPGDRLGPLTARFLGAETIVTPVSSNGLVGGMGFAKVLRSRIGSPYVIAGIEAVLAEAPRAKVVGYEANGGFLLGFTAKGPAGPLPPLMTRDCLLPILAPLAAARAAGQSLAALSAALPARFTAADRLTGIGPEIAQPFLARLGTDPAARADFLARCWAILRQDGDANLPGAGGQGAGLGREEGLDLTDGLRLSLAGGEVLHLRPSGNAPEFRVYTEAANPLRAEALLRAGLRAVAAQLS